MAALEDAPIAGQLTVDDCIREAENSATPPPVVFTNVTPSGLTVEYSPAPRRYYGLYDPGFPEKGTVEVPSVTAVLGVLEKPGLAWWGQRVAVEGVCALYDVGLLQSAFDPDNVLPDEGGGLSSWWTVPDQVVTLLTQKKLTVNHTLTKAGDRGTSVHDAFEDWAVHGTIPHPEIYPEAERPYVEGLAKFITDWELSAIFNNEPMERQAEVMVGSLAHKFAGRYDLRCVWGGGRMVVKTYPKKANKVEELPAGRYMLDLKTSSGVYKSHALQLAAYEGASVECGYESTDYRAVIHVTKTGEYELVVTTATLDDFLSVRSTYEVMQKKLVA